MPVKIGTAPNYFQHRGVIAASDDPATAPVGHGINFQERSFGLIQVLPTGGADPTVGIFYWSEELELFIQSSPAILFAALGADVPGEIVVETKGRIVLPSITIAGGSVRLFVSTFGPDGRF